MSNKVLITAALLYANGRLHFGHIGGAYLPADCYARFCRLLGKDVLFISGSDEHGVPITLNAELSQKTPQEYVDFYDQINRELFDKFQISFDHFSRTTWKEHADLTKEFFLDLIKNGHIEVKIAKELFSLEDQRFLADRYVVGTCPKCKFEEARGDECPKCGGSFEAIELKNPRSKLTNAKLVLKPTKHWYLRFDHFQEKLQKWIKKKKWKSNVVHFAQNYIDELKERSITRDLSWGISVPLDEAKGKVFYVWFDAPIGYISATKEWAKKVKKKPKAWEDYWLDPKTHYVQFIGKDNIPFHAIFFPAMIMGQNQNYKLVDELPANEFYNLEGKQFSKSSGWDVDLEAFFKIFSADQIRYAIASNAPETQDSEFSWRDFQMRSNTHLLGKYGNFVNRTLVFVKNHLGGTLPLLGDLEREDEAFLEKIEEKRKEIYLAYTHFRLRRASQIIMEIATLGNTYFDFKKPWKLVKESLLKKELKKTLALCLKCLQTLSIVSYPIIPHAAEKLWKLLGFSSSLSDENWEDAYQMPLTFNGLLPAPKVLFKKVEDEQIEREIAKLKKREKEVTSLSKHRLKPFKETIPFETFEKIDLRIGLILSATPVKKSKKLMKLEVDLGLEKRTIVSGIQNAFRDSDHLVGKKALFIANLKPAKLMGIESQGLLLCVGEEKELELLEVSKACPGDGVS